MIKIVISLLIGSFLISCQQSTSLKKIPKPLVDKTRKADPGRAFISGKVDILFVVDDSGSMGTHQSNLAANIDLFADRIFKARFLDYHIGVTTSDKNRTGKAADGRLINKGGPNYIEQSTPNGLGLLASYLKVGTSGGGTEYFMDNIRLALSPALLNTTNKGFYRDDAYFMTVIVTDTFDHSGSNPQDLINYLTNLKNGRSDYLLAYGAIIPSGVNNCVRDENKNPVRIEQFIKDLGGAYFSLCSPKFGEELVEISKELLSKISRVYLENVPALNTIKVTFGTQVIDQDPETGWDYDPTRNMIFLGRDIVLEKQPKGTKLEVSYLPAKEEDR